MNASMARLESGLPKVKPDRRRELRFTAWHDAILESSQGHRDNVLVADISMHGCSVRSEASWLKPGCFVSLGLNESQMLQAVVRWVRDGAAGMEFLRPVPSDHSDWQDLIDLQF